MSRAFPTRRAVLAAGAGACLSPFAPAFASTLAPSRTAIVDWALLETSLALGAVPQSAVELVLYRRLVIEPPLPETVADLGLRGSINFERLASLRPDRIYRSSFSAWAHDLLARIAPVRELTIFKRGEKPFGRAEAALRKMADDFGLADRAARYVEDMNDEFARLGRGMRHLTNRPLLVVNLGDARHFRAFGEDSMFGEVAARMGFRNSWGARTSYSATAPVGIEAMAGMPDAIVAVLEPIPPEARRVLPESALWQAMPAVREGRVVRLPPVNPFGGLPSARRFARLFAEGAAVLP